MTLTHNHLSAFCGIPKGGVKLKKENNHLKWFNVQVGPYV